MATDDDRRDVARRLRNLPGDSTYPDLIGVIADRDGWYPAADAADRLADLIEPSGHECVPGECPLNVRHDNDRIDRDALLALADELEEDACWEVQSPGVDNCAWRLKDVCDRIREALGVEHG